MDQTKGRSYHGIGVLMLFAGLTFLLVGFAIRQPGLLVLGPVVSLVGLIVLGKNKKTR
jgi:hypothetical protein